MPTVRSLKREQSHCADGKPAGKPHIEEDEWISLFRLRARDEKESLLRSRRQRWQTHSLTIQNAMPQCYVPTPHRSREVDRCRHMYPKLVLALPPHKHPGFWNKRIFRSCSSSAPTSRSPRNLQCKCPAAPDSSACPSTPLCAVLCHFVFCSPCPAGRSANSASQRHQSLARCSDATSTKSLCIQSYV